MKAERTRVELPLWRKKVDSSLFVHKGTAIPKWVCQLWNLDNIFPDVKGKKDLGSKIEIFFLEKKFKANITCTWPKKRADKVYRLFFGDDLKSELKNVFLMSFMRDIENRLRENNKSDIEEDIPFWEFLDIEFDGDAKSILLTAHYTQVPIFPELFRRLTYSPALKRIDDELNKKNEMHIFKQDWRPREDLGAEIGAENVIYMLLDTNNKLFYVGEAENLTTRLQSGHPKIRDWDWYRYDVLPEVLRDMRVHLERMMIRSFATVLPNKRKIESKVISEYVLANEKIDL
ncbi:MAG: GIY-YIG nuclease family protein [Chloroflexota bacterium]|nr:GIY-YIG nuclease family protein [Chloroflexota bacterium]